MQYLIYNHKLTKAQDAKISFQDRGFRFGDGIFETCLIKNSEIQNWSAHLKRLEEGLSAIKIQFESQNLENSCQKLITKNQVNNGILRIAISRGVGSSGYLPKPNIKPTLIIETLKKPAKPKAPIKLMISSYQKPSLKSLPVNYKLANALNSTLVKIEAQEKGYFDGIILNEKDEICETSSANIFWLKDEILFTPSLECGCLKGTIREKIIQTSNVREVKAGLEDLLQADSVFLTNVAFGILPVNEVLKTKFKKTEYAHKIRLD